MSTTLPPGDAQGASPRSVLPDEQALRHVFDDEFPVLVRSAREELGEAASLAPRVVEAAFVHAWEQRDRMDTPMGLHAFLRDDVHHGVARAKSRRAAAHRLGHHDEPNHGNGAHVAAHAPAHHVATDAPVDVETSWQHVVATIHDQGPSLEARAQAAQASRHDAAVHVAEIAKPRTKWWVPVAGGLVALLVIAAGIRWMDRASGDVKLVRALASPEARLVSSNRGQMANVTLGEGTRVRLAPETRVTIPKDFDASLRGVKLDGAATFEPAPGLDLPLQVHARNVVIVATGTSFSVRAWDKEPLVAVRVHSGSVDVRAGEESRRVGPGEALLVASDGAMRAPSAEELETQLGWTDGTLVIVNQPLKDVLGQLRRWYGMEVGAADPSLLERPVTLRSPITSAKEAVAAIEASAGVKYGYAGRNELVFKDTAAVAPAKK